MSRRGRRRSAAGAAALAFLSAGVTIYWTLGGTALLDTVGGSIEEAARRRGGLTIALGLATFALKAAGGLLALALLEAWQRPVPRLLVLTAKVASVILVVYGGVSVLGAGAGLAGVVGEGAVDRTALWGHLLLWDPWFVLWGTMLWLAVPKATTRNREGEAAGDRGPEDALP